VGRATDLLFVLTERHAFFILEWDAARGHLKTLVKGDAAEDIGRPADTAPTATIDPTNRAIAIHGYDGLLRVVALDEATGGVSKHFKVRLDELSLLDMRFSEAPSPAGPLLVVLQHDTANQVRRCGTPYFLGGHPVNCTREFPRCCARAEPCAHLQPCAQMRPCTWPSCVGLVRNADSVSARMPTEAHSQCNILAACDVHPPQQTPPLVECQRPQKLEDARLSRGW
jgi:hypothetical protein